MGDYEERVCCMCGDVGFPDKLFHCSRCSFRFQHSYCSNYYYGNDSSSSSSSSTLCDWCLSEGRNNNNSFSSNHTTHSKHLIKIKSSSSSSSSSLDNINTRSEYGHGERIKQHDHHQQQQTANNNNNNVASPGVARNSGIPSPRTGTHRRYKLLKDVMC